MVIGLLKCSGHENIGNFFLSLNSWYCLKASSISLILIRGLSIYSLNRTCYIAWTRDTPEGIIGNPSSLCVTRNITWVNIENM